MTKYALALCSVLFLSGCATVMTPILPTAEHTHVPEKNQVRTVTLGQTVLSRGTAYTYEGMDLENQVTAGDGYLLKKMIVQPGTLTAKQEDPNTTYYFSDTFSIWDAMLGSISSSGGLKIDKKKADNIAIFTNSPYNFSLNPSQKPIFKLHRVKAADKASYQQELFYVGKTGETVKFLYREISSEHLQSPYSQEFKYDLSASHEIGLKGARIEIMEATNDQLKYTVLENFTDMTASENSASTSKPIVTEPSNVNPPAPMTAAAK